MNIEIGAQFPERKYINGIALAVQEDPWGKVFNTGMVTPAWYFLPDTSVCLVT
jgi:hypothetical protein